MNLTDLCQVGTLVGHKHFMSTKAEFIEILCEYFTLKRDYLKKKLTEFETLPTI